KKKSATLPSLAYIRDSIIQSNTVVTFDVVLDMLNNKAKTLLVPSQLPQTAVKTEPAKSESHAASALALLTYKCRDGRHNPSKNHTAKQCFALHPNFLDKYRTRLKLRKLKTHPATHLTLAFSLAITRITSPRGMNRISLHNQYNQLRIVPIATTSTQSTQVVPNVAKSR
ncbi:uncharacterized protein VP01_9782g1, partial [Puccinia sorghi]